MFWFGWTAEKGTHWIVSVIGMFTCSRHELAMRDVDVNANRAIGITLFAIGAFVLFQCIFMYLPLTYPQYAASLFAANDLCRAMMAAGCIIWAYPLYVNLGIGRGISLLGGLLVGGVGGIWCLWYWGAKLRAKSSFAMG